MPVTSPEFITRADWASISGALIPLWLLVFSVLGMAFSFLAAHGLLVSLRNTRHVPAGLAARLRPPLYVASVVFFGCALASAYLFVSRLDIIQTIYDRGPR